MSSGASNTVSSTTNDAVPSAMTTINLTSSVNYTGFLAPSLATGPNGDSATINYDTLAVSQSTVHKYLARMGVLTSFSRMPESPSAKKPVTARENTSFFHPCINLQPIRKNPPIRFFPPL